MLKSLIKDTAIYGAADFFFKLINFATFPIFAHLFTVDQFGIFSLATTMAALIAVIFNCGLNNSVQRYYMDPHTTKEEQPVYVTTGLICLVFFSIVLGTAALGITYYFKEAIFEHDQLPWGLIALAIIGTFPTQIFQFCLDLLRLYFKPWNFTALCGLQNGLSIGLSLFFVLYFQMGIEGYLFGVILSYIAVAPIGLWCIRRSLSWSFCWKKCRSLISFGYPFIFAGIAYWIFGSMDRWMLIELSTTTDVGIYSTAFKFGTIMIFINTAFGQAWTPHALKVFRTEKNYKEIYSNFFSIWFFFLVIIGSAISVFGEEILRFMTPPSYWPAAKVVPFLVFGMVFYGTTQMTAVGISLEKKTFYFSIATWSTAFINFFLNLYLIPKHGAEGAAFATLASYFALTSFYLIITQYLHPLPIDFKKSGSSFAMVLCTLCFNHWLQKHEPSSGLMLLKGGYVSLLVVIGIMLKIIRPLDFSEFVRKKSEIRIES